MLESGRCAKGRRTGSLRNIHDADGFSRQGRLCSPTKLWVSRSVHEPTMTRALPPWSFRVLLLWFPCRDAIARDAIGNETLHLIHALGRFGFVDAGRRVEVKRQVFVGVGAAVGRDLPLGLGEDPDVGRDPLHVLGPRIAVNQPGQDGIDPPDRREVALSEGDAVQVVDAGDFKCARDDDNVRLAGGAGGMAFSAMCRLLCRLPFSGHPHRSRRPWGMLVSKLRLLTQCRRQIRTWYRIQCFRLGRRKRRPG